MARYNGDGDRRGRPRLRVSESVRERKREHRGATRDISASGAAVVAEPGIEDRSSVDLDIEDVGGHLRACLTPFRRRIRGRVRSRRGR